MDEMNRDDLQSEAPPDAEETEERKGPTVLFVVNVPVENADAVRKAMHDAGAGKLGNYSHCSFSYRGVGRFMPNDEAQPHIGTAEQISAVEEVRIEILCNRSILPQVVAAMKEAHPYEEPAYHAISIEIQ